MGFVKRYEDGAVYDAHNGYRSAAVVAKQKAAGTYTEPAWTEQEKKNVLHGVILLAVVILVSLIAYLAIITAKHDAANNDALINAVNGNMIYPTQVLGDHYDGGDSIILLVVPEEGYEPVTIKCEVEKDVDTGDGIKALVFCNGQAIVTADLPYTK